jgi:CMP-N,N'-diacetyllegionaminic acid synthase
MNFLGIIPARGGSKGIPRKNLKPLNGKEMIFYTIQASQESKLLSETIISTDDEEIAMYCRNVGANVPFLRPTNIAEDRTPMIDVVMHAMKVLAESGSQPDAIVLLQPTSPLRKGTHIDAAIEIFKQSKADTVVSVTRVPHHFVPECIYRESNGRLVPYVDTFPVYDRTQKPTYLARNGPAILITSTNVLLENNSFYGRDIRPYEMDSVTSMDIDTPFDFSVAETFLRDSTGR